MKAIRKQSPDYKPHKHSPSSGRIKTCPNFILPQAKKTSCRCCCAKYTIATSFNLFHIASHLYKSKSLNGKNIERLRVQGGTLIKVSLYTPALTRPYIHLY